MKKLILPLMALALLFTTSCAKEDSVDVNQDKIYTDYEIYYNENTDKTQVAARFRFGGATGTILELSDGANVTFNGTALPYNGLVGGHFKEYAGKISSGSFRYTDVDGNVFNNTLPAMDTIAWPADFDTISQSAASTLAWVGNPLAVNERVDLFLGSGTWEWGDDALLLQLTQGASDIVIGTNDVDQLTAGSSVTGYMDRVYAVDVSEGTSEGGRMRTRFKANNQTIQIVN